MKPGAQVKSLREVGYQGELVPANTHAFVLEVADVEGFLVVEWIGRLGLYSVHASDVEETHPPTLH
jgi:hypothetical protein